MKAILGTVLGIILGVGAGFLGFACMVYYILAVVWFVS
jgi:hypothetical protein